MAKDDYFSNEYDQSKVAYEDGPKEVNSKRDMPASKQWGKGDKMPQKDVKIDKEYPANPSLRHKEHR